MRGSRCSTPLSDSSKPKPVGSIWTRFTLVVQTHYRITMLLSDRDIRAELDAGRVKLEPYDPTMIQPSSVDVRLDRFFRLFDNHRYPVIDPSQDQPELTKLVEMPADEPFILHPGEF